MGYEDQMKFDMHTFNEGMENAFQEMSHKDAIEDVMDYFCRTMGAQRGFVFAMASNGSYMLAYEWMAEGLAPARDVWQKLPRSLAKISYSIFPRQKVLTLESIDDLRGVDDESYKLLKERDAENMVVGHLRYRGESLGFFGLMNVPGENLKSAAELMAGLDYIIALLVHEQKIENRLNRTGVIDKLTGVGNRHSLFERVDAMNPEESIGVIFVDINGLKDINESQGYTAGNEILVDVCGYLSRYYGQENVFRIGGDEFLVLVNGSEQNWFQYGMTFVGKYFEGKGMDISLGDYWEEKWVLDFDMILQISQMRMYEQKRNYRSSSKHKNRVLEGPANLSIYKGDEFFNHAENWLSNYKNDKVIFVAVDMNYFKLYNDIFGIEAGNNLLNYCGNVLQMFSRNHGGLCGYLGGDNFCLLLSDMNCNDSEVRQRITNEIIDNQFPEGFYPACGVYICRDLSESVSQMYDKSLVALSDIKGDYNLHVGMYDESHYQHMRDTHLLLIDARKAMENKEFIFYVQPKVEISSGRIISCEALVRWVKDGKVVPTASFIPAMEGNGYIFALDQYMWEEVFRWQKRLMGRGIEALPISLNVSRIDFYYLNVSARFMELSKQYDVPPNLIILEISESAFTEADLSMQRQLKELSDFGFLLSIDDFGFSNTSLSSLGDLNANILKTDFRFLGNNPDFSKNLHIIESIVNLAHMMRMTVIVMGVETLEQLTELEKLNCKYIQGFYCYKPMPVEEYEKLIRNPMNVEAVDYSYEWSTVGRLHLKELMDEKLLKESIVDQNLGAMALYEVYEDRVILLQMNQSYFDMTGLDQDDDYGRSHITEYMSLDQEAILESFRQADLNPETGFVSESKYLKSDGNEITMQGRMFPLSEKDGHRFYLIFIKEI